MMSEYYQLIEKVGVYPIGTNFYVVESRNWNQLGATEYSEHTDGFWIGPPTGDTPKDDKCLRCVTRSGLKINRHMFKRVYL